MVEFRHDKIDDGATDYYSVVDGEFAVSLMVMSETGILVYHRKVPAGYGGSAMCDHFPFCEARMIPVPGDAPVLKFSVDKIREFLTDKVVKVNG